jgi:histidinol-phosphate phosphatase family protein
MKREIQAVFLDRDGTIGGDGGFRLPKDFTLYPYAVEAIKMLKKAGIKLFVLSNQHLIAEGRGKVEEFAEQLIGFGFDEAYICPHAKDAGCSCRKPKPGMIYAAAEKYGLDLSKCAVIGDIGEADIMAGANAGCIKILVRTGSGEDSLTKHRDKWAEVEPDYIAENVLDAVKWLLE